MSELWELSATNLVEKIRNREVSASEALESCIRRTEAVNPDINAITIIYADEARAAAQVADELQAKGGSIGPLHGIPVSVKENIDVKGWPTTWGLPAFENTISEVDAPIVAQLKEAGAIPFAATNLPDFALRWNTDSSLRGKTNNPWDAKRTPGGSSGGAAAALACGMGPLALGNDVGGSLRYPAQCCGAPIPRFGKDSAFFVVRLSDELGKVDEPGFSALNLKGLVATSV